MLHLVTPSILNKDFYHYKPVTSNEVGDCENLGKQSRQLDVIREVDFFLNKYVVLIEIMPCNLIFKALHLFSSYVYIYPSEQKLFTQIFVKYRNSYDLDNPENFEVWLIRNHNIFYFHIFLNVEQELED